MGGSIYRVSFLLNKISMKKKHIKIPKFWIGIPPWIILGTVLILLPIFSYMTIENINRQKESTTKLLVEKGAALIRSFEAGTRTGMMGMMGMQKGGFQIQRLLMETAQQPDIVNILVADAKGTILAHNDPSMIGESYGQELDLKRISCSQNLEWRRVSDRNGSVAFEVFRKFSPTRGPMQRHHGRGRSRNGKQGWKAHTTPEGITVDTAQVIFVGLDMAPVEAARKDDVRHAIVMAAILLLIGFGGTVSLFLAQAYRSTKASLSIVRAFSDNLVENMPIGLIATNADNRIVSFNQTAESILQTSASHVILKKPRERLPRAIWEIIERLKSKRNLIQQEIDCPTKKGKSIPLEVIGSSLEGEEKARLGDILLFRDLSEIQHLKKEIERSARLASIGKLAAGVAHEIRNPLSSIKGFATYFKERYRKVPEDQKTAEIMIQEVERLNRVITQLLEFARPMDIHKRLTSLGVLVEDSLKLIEGDLSRKGLKADVHIASDMPELKIDPDKFKQVLLNLYLNAIDAMEKGSTLTVEARQEEDTRGVQITISDTGKGIEEEDLPHIFDPYFTTKSSGTGLGLAIVHKIIESHGGKIRVNSQTGIGTDVIIWLASPG
jgi:two-component system sensor histidine kinase HydH